MSGGVIAYLGVDPSASNTGACALAEDGSLLFYADCGQGKRKGPSSVASHLAQAELLAGLLALYELKAVAWENYSFNSQHRAYTLAECNGILKAAVWRLFGKPFTYVAPAELKKFAVGNGMAGKEAMMAQAKAECPELPEDASSDVCDAYFLAKLGWHMDDAQRAASLEKGNSYLRTRVALAKKIRDALYAPEGRKHS